MGTTVTGTLKMFDAMTAPLKKITSSMNMMISTMQRMQDTTDKNVKVDKSLLAAQRQIAQAESEINKQIQQANRSHEKFNQTIHRGHKNTDGLLSTLKGVAAAYLSFQTAKDIGGATIGGAMKQQEMINTFAARTGNKEHGQAIYDQTVKQALKYGQDVNATLGSSMSFMSATMDPKQLQELNKLAMRLSKLNPTEGMEGAAFSLKELLSGDYASIAERFNISRSMLKDSSARIAGMNGDVNGFIKGMDDLLNKQNLTEKAFESMLDSPAAKWNRALETFKFNLASAGQGGLQALVPLFDRINKGFETGAFQNTFDMISMGVTKVVEGLMWMLEKATAVYEFFKNNWSTIEPIVYGLVAAFVLLKGTLLLTAAAQGAATAAMTIQSIITFLNTAATLGLATAWRTLNAAMKANIIIMIVSAIIALVVWLVNLWNTNDQFAAFFLRTWNKILGFFDQIPIFFTKIGYGIANAFDWARVQSLKIMQDLVNGVIDGINFLINALKKIPGVTLNTLDHVEFAASAAAEAEAKRQSREATIKGMESAAATKAAEREANVVKMLEDRAAKRAKDKAEKDAKNKKIDDLGNKFSGSGAGLGKMPNIDKVGKVGKIEDKVDISSEDLKTMRELAEMKSIQNFVTLTPTVQVTTGPVSKDVDIDTIVARINDTLQEDIAAGAAGVFA